MIKDLFPAKHGVKIGIYPSLGEVCVKVTVQAHSKLETEKMLRPVKKTLCARFKTEFYAEAEGVAFEALAVEALRKSKKTIALVESCTGGLLAWRLTKVPGSSKVFKRGIIAYSDQTKTELAGVKKEMLTRFGAVSIQVAKAMAEHIRTSGATDIGIAITGIAGPGGATQDKPVGLVYCAVATKKGTVVYKLAFSGTREQIQYLTSQRALKFIYDTALNRKTG